MDKIWVKDVKEGDRPKSVFLVARKAVTTAKSGKTYLAATFQDKTGELEARAFEKVDELAAAFDEKDFVEVEGIVGTFQGKPQIRIESLAKVDPAALDPAEFTWVPPPEPKKPERPAAGAEVVLQVHQHEGVGCGLEDHGTSRLDTNLSLSKRPRWASLRGPWTRSGSRTSRRVTGRRVCS